MELAVSVIGDKECFSSQEKENKTREEDQKRQEESGKHPTCCCCISLKRAAKIIAFAQITLSILYFIMLTAIDFGQLKKTADMKNELRANNSMSNTTINGSDDEEEGFCGAQSVELEALIMASTAVRLIIGVYKNKPNLIEAWCHTMTELICLSLFQAAIRVAFLYYIGQNFLIYDITEPIFQGIMCYFTYTVFRYYRSIKGKTCKGNGCSTT